MSPVDIRGIALEAIKEMRRTGESHEMCARWISERVTAALAGECPVHKGLGVEEETV